MADDPRKTSKAEDQRQMQERDKKTSPVRSVNDSGLITYLHKKTERLASVLFLLTNDMPHEEPLKWQLRKAHLCAVDACMRMRYEGSRTHISVLEYEAGQLADCRHLIDLARIAGWISGMNADLLRQEYNALIEIIEGRTHSQEPLKHLLLDPAFFTLTKGGGKQSAVDRYSTDEATRAHLNTLFNGYDDVPEPPPAIKDKNEKEDVRVSQKSERRAASASPEKARTQQTPEQKRQKAKKRERKTATKHARREKILALLKQKGGRTIKDIAAHIEGCSEKTVQRELNTLIKSGRVSRKGERRWSTYTLAP